MSMDIQKRYTMSGEIQSRRPNMRITCKERYQKSLSMSFLEASSKRQNINIIPYSINLSSSQRSSIDKLPSTNKWNANSTNFNINKLKNAQSRSFDENNNTIKRRSSSTFSSGNIFFNSTDELLNVQENSKPILKLFASKQKENELNQKKRNSIHSSNDIISNGQVVSLKQSLKDTPWGKYFQQKKTSNNEERRPKSHIEIRDKNISSALNENSNRIDTDKNTLTEEKSKLNCCIVDNKNKIPEKVTIVKKHIQPVSKPIHQNISKDNTNSTNVNTATKSCQLNEIQTKRQTLDTLSHEEIKKSDENNSSGNRLTKKLKKYSLQVNLKKDSKESKIKRSKSLEYNSVKEEAKNSTFPFFTESDERKDIEKQFIKELDDNTRNTTTTVTNYLDKTDLIDNKNLHDHKNIKRQQSLIIYDPKEKIKRAKSLSLTTYDIAIDSLDDEDKEASKYTDIDQQITGVSPRRRKASAPESSRNIKTKSSNITVTCQKSEPPQDSLVNGNNNESSNRIESSDVFESSLEENIESLEIVNCQNQLYSEMSRSTTYQTYTSKYSSPLLENGLTKTSPYQTNKSTYLSGNGFDNINSRTDYNPRVYSRLRNNSESCSETKNLVDSNSNRSKVNYRSQRASSDLTSNFSESYQPKSSYLRQRLKEIETNSGKNSGSFFKRAVSSPSGSNDGTKRYDPDETDAFIKYHKERYKRESEKNRITSTQGNSYLEKYKQGYNKNNVKRSASVSSSYSETNEEIRTHRRTFSQDSNPMDFMFRRSSSLCSSSGSSSAGGHSSSRKNSGNSAESFSFLRNTSLRSSGSKAKSLLFSKQNRQSTPDNESTTVSGDKKPVFGSITKVSASKISGAEELKSFSARRRNRLRSAPDDYATSPSQSKTNQPTAEQKPVEKITDSAEKSTSPTSPTNEHDKKFSRFSLRKKNSQDIIAVSGETKSEQKTSRKHSISNYFRKSKSIDSSPGSPIRSPSPTSNDDSLKDDLDKDKLTRRSSSPITSPTSPPTTSRKSSGFFKIFHRKGSAADHSAEENTIKETEEISDTPKKVVSRVISISSVSNKKGKSNMTGKGIEVDDKRKRSQSETMPIGSNQVTDGRLRSKSLQSDFSDSNKKDIFKMTVGNGTTNTLVEETETDIPDIISSEDKPSDNKPLNKDIISSVPNSSLGVPTVNGDLGSRESLYSDNDFAPRSKSTSKNKERIRNRKAAKLEAKERRSMPTSLTNSNIDFTNSDDINKALSNNHDSDLKQANESESNTPKTPQKRKKHKARRANTEFISPAITVQEPSPIMSHDDNVVLRRNNRRNRRDRPKTLTSGIDSELIFGQDIAKSGSSEVVNENLSFAEIKKKLLEGLTDEKKIPDKSSTKERQKIKRTKSTKRYKTITEGIAPRDLELARQAMNNENNQDGKKTIDDETLAQITAALTSTSDKRKSFVVEGRPPSRYTSMENLNTSNPDLSRSNEFIATPRPAMLKRTKSMTTLHMNIDIEKDEEEPEIKPLSELKNRFLQAMEDTKQKHLQKKTPVEIKRRNKTKDRKSRPHTICGLDDWTMEQIKSEVGETPENEEKKKAERKKENGSNVNNKENNVPVESKKREKKKYQRVDSKKLFDDLFDDLEDLLNDGVTEADLAGALEVNPSLHQEAHVKSPKEIDLKLTGNEPAQQEEPPGKVPSSPQQPLNDLDFIASNSSQLSSSIAETKRNVRPQRKHKNKANPIKALQQRDDLINEEDVEARLKEEKKMKRTSSNLNKDLAEEAISALRATVDFSKTKLRKVEVGKKSNDILVEEFQPTSVTNLLIQVKGRKKVQTSVVDFNVSSLNSNDCFIIVTPKDLICWNGADSNVIEKAKAAEIASRINQKKEMGCKALEVLYIDEGSGHDGRVLRTLEYDGPNINFNGATALDEDFEKTVTSAYMVYTVCEVSDPPVLLPLDSQCHRMPSKDILQTDTAFVFDFISEVYVWIGRQTSTQQRKIIQKLAAEKFQEGYFRLNLVSTHTSQPHLGTSRRISIVTESKTQHVRRGSKQGRRVSVQQGRHQHRDLVPRPDHSLLLLLYEGSEWVIFKEKFCDWPDESRIIRMKGGPVGQLQKEVSTDIMISAVDPTTMVEKPKEPNMVLEGIDLGRGLGIPKGMDGHHVVTIDVQTWHVSENNSILMPDESFGQLHSGEGYVIRWHYRIVKVRAARQVDDILKAGGIDRCCYFFWLGNDCSVNEEGATAVMTIELDKEKGPQIRVVLGKEPPALLNIFGGSMVIHAGKRPAPGLRTQFTDQSSIRLYCIRNEEENEACLLQVPAYCESLRSRSSFLLLLCSQGEIFVWHGCKSNEGTRKTILHAAHQLIENHPEEAAIGEKTEIGLTEVEEGEEPEVFWIALGGQEDYGSLVDSSIDVSSLSPRLFKLDATSDTFIAHEISCPSRSSKHNCPFPILQDDLYNVEQPGVFLVDAENLCYVWFGWWPDEEDNEVSTSRRRRWGEERRKALESAVLYAEHVGRKVESLYVVYAGLEPESFIELFPYWVIQEDITDLQLDEGLEEDKLYSVAEELAMFSKEFYTIDELRAKPPPQGVDPTKLEKYLSPEDFLAVFRFAKETFYKLPGWQQVNWKKKVGLY